MMKTIGVLIFAVMILLSACQQTSSNDIGSTPVYQRYKVEFSADREVKAFAHFSENKDSDYKDIELEGEQKITVNNHSMAYNDIDEQEDFSYSYSAVLGKGIKTVTFVFVRRKGTVYTNTVTADIIEPIAIPVGLQRIVSGQALVWEGAVASSGEEILAELTKDGKDRYELYNAVVDNDAKTIVFHDVPAGDNYTLTIKRLKEIPTQENDLPAKGKIQVFYYAIKSGIQVD